MAASLEESIDRRVHGTWIDWLMSQQTFWVSVAARAIGTPAWAA